MTVEGENFFLMFCPASLGVAAETVVLLLKPSVPTE
jgi:hypothetical protein